MAIEFRTKFWPAMKDGPPGIGTKLSERYFNPIWTRIDNRLHALEELRISWVTATNELIAFGLQRIDSVLAPAFIRVGRIAELGFLTARSTTTETLALDQVSTFIIQDLDERELFHPSPWVAITKPGSSTDIATGQVLSYVKSTGILDVMIRDIYGDPGPHSDWQIATGSGVTLYVKNKAAAAATDRALAQAAATAAIEAKNITNAAAILIANGPVSSVNGKIGAAVLSAADVGALSIAQGEQLEEDILESVDAVVASTARVTARAVHLSGF